jgi:hypothetical protein
MPTEDMMGNLISYRDQNGNTVIVAHEIKKAQLTSLVNAACIDAVAESRASSPSLARRLLRALHLG